MGNPISDKNESMYLVNSQVSFWNRGFGLHDPKAMVLLQDGRDLEEGEGLAKI